MNRGLIQQLQADLRRRSVYFGIALAALLAWLIIAGVYIGLLASHADPALAGHQAGDALFPRLRQLDAFWPFVGLALFQLLVLKLDDRRWTDAIALLVLVAGLALCVARQFVPVEMRDALQLAEAGCAIVIAALSAQKMAVFLGGRAINISDVWTFIALQWLLVWTGASAYLAWMQNPQAGLSEDRRLFLYQLATLGICVHVLAAMALRSLKGSAGPVVRQRAGLLALPAYNTGLVLLLCDFKMVGIIVMLAGLAALVPALWPEKGLARSLLAPVTFLVAALCILPWERSAFSAWRHGVGAGAVGMAALIAAIVAASTVLPKRFRPRLLPGVGLALFAAGVAVRMGTEILFQWRRGTSTALALSAALEMAGAVIVAVALIHGMRALGQRLR